MVIETGLSHTSQLSEALNIRSAPAAEKTDEEAGQEAKIPEQGDTVALSQEARALSAAAKADESDSGLGGAGEDESLTKTLQKEAIRRLKEQIKLLQEEIEAIKESNLPDKQKQKQIQAKQVEIMQLNDQLVEAEKEQTRMIAGVPSGGTPAEGAGSSVSSF
jgi:predicted RNase H-like nuclease (RuvC/YqgF family)